MKPLSSAAILLCFLTVQPAFLKAQSTDSIRYNRDPEFWERFEREVNRFVDDAVNGFSSTEARRDDSTIVRSGSWNDDSPANRAWTPRYDYRKFRRYGTPSYVPWISENTIQDHMIFRYNRVEGLFLGAGSEKQYYWESGKQFNPYGSIGYGFISHRWRYDLGVARQIPIGSEDNNQLIEVGAEGYSLTDARDPWRISMHENTLAAFFLREDFRDYFGRGGATVHAAYLYRDYDAFAEARLAYQADKYSSLVQDADWSLFGGHKNFRSNPAINDGMMRSVVALAGFSTASKSRFGMEGWNLHTTAEFAGGGLGGEFQFQQYIADLRRYQPLGRYDNLNMRLRVGTAHGALPLQKAYELGGLGTLPAFAYNSLQGDSIAANRMILFNAEYILNGDFLRELSFWPSWLFRHINLIFLADAGMVRTISTDASPFSGFKGLTWSEMRSDAGVGVSNRSGSFRLAAVWRTDRSEPARLVLRVEAPF